MNKLKSNILASIFLQVITIISGFILPKIILSYFGSNINGLISSINQFLSYITLLEGGISSVIMSILYKPLAENDKERISKIVNATVCFFKLLGIIYLVYVFVFGFIYPIFIYTGFSYKYSVVLIWILALNFFFQYFLSVSYRLLLNADRKVAFVSFVQSVVILLNMIGVIICFKLFKDIVIIKLVSALVFVIQPSVFFLYVKKHYSINKEDGLDEYTVKHRWDGFGINTAFFIHSNTDIVVLTIFASLADVSIYSIYLLIVKALKNLVLSISSAIVPSFGKVLASGDIEKCNKVFTRYEYGIEFITIIIFTCGIILITPFVDIYTMGISDANYHQVLFGVLIVFSELIDCYRDPYVSASYAAGHIKQVSKYAYIEAGINIIISVFLVGKIGLLGVAIGTIIAMTYRTIAQVLYLKNNILYRPIKSFIKNTLTFMLALFISVGISFSLFNMFVSSYFEWIILGIRVFLIVSVAVVIMSFVFNRRTFINFINSVISKEKDK